MEGGCLGYPGASTLASQPLDRILPPWLANPRNPAMSPHSRHLSHWWNSGGEKNKGMGGGEDAKWTAPLHAWLPTLDRTSVQSSHEPCEPALMGLTAGFLLSLWAAWALTLLTACPVSLRTARPLSLWTAWPLQLRTARPLSLWAAWPLSLWTTWPQSWWTAWPLGYEPLDR